MVKFRGNQIGMIFQDPMSSLDPVYTVGQQLTEAIEVEREEANEEILMVRTIR